MMDEPFSGLDVMAKRRVFDTIQKVSSDQFDDEVKYIEFSCYL